MQDRATRTAHPRWLAQRLADDWPDQVAQILDANNAHPAFWLRVNRRHHTAAAYRERLAERGHCRARRRVSRLSRCCWNTRSTCTSCRVSARVGCRCRMALRNWRRTCSRCVRGERVLDACAAPGGKTCHLLELQPELAELVAVDVSAPRLVRVRENLARLGLRATLVTGDADDPSQWWDGRPFERILLDVPCSATGVIRRHPDIKLLRRPDDIVTLARRQGRLLASAWSMLAAWRQAGLCELFGTTRREQCRDRGVAKESAAGPRCHSRCRTADRASRSDRHRLCDCCRHG